VDYNSVPDNGSIFIRLATVAPPPNLRNYAKCQEKSNF